MYILELEGLHKSFANQLLLGSDRKYGISILEIIIKSHYWILLGSFEEEHQLKIAQLDSRTSHKF